MKHSTRLIWAIPIGFFGAIAATTLAIAQAIDQASEEARIRAEFQAEKQRYIDAAVKDMSPEDRQKTLRFIAANDAAVQHIDGRQTPELVPYWLRMRGFFDAFDVIFKPQLERQLSATDLAILSEYAHNQFDLDKKLSNEAHKKGERSVVLKAKNMSPGEIARALTAVTDRDRAQQAERYRTVINKLSEDGQKIVNDIAFTHVRPSFAIYDPAITANLEPELYKEQFILVHEELKRLEADPNALPPIMQPLQCDPWPQCREGGPSPGNVRVNPVP